MRTDKIGPYLLGPNDTPENGIYTGDARELTKAIPDESADSTLIDPPFGIGFKYANDYNDSRSDYVNDWLSWLPSQSNRIIKAGALAFVFQAGPRLKEVWQYFPPHSRIFAMCKNFVQMGKRCRQLEEGVSARKRLQKAVAITSGDWPRFQQPSSSPTWPTSKRS